MPISNILMQQAANGRQKSRWNSKTWEGSLITSSDFNFTSTTDGPTVIKHLTELTINTGATLTTSTRCKGLIFFINGNCTINGTISMNSRGAYATGYNLAIDYLNADLLTNPANLVNYDQTILTASASGRGGNGYGGGAGAEGTSYSGGGGGGGKWNGSGSPAIANGGPGGAGKLNWDTSFSYCGGGGAGNPGGAASGGSCRWTSPSKAGQSGTGGLIVLVVKGNLTIGSTGVITSNGTSGGQGSAGGGGSGGGCIRVLYSGTYINNGSIRANGGSGGYSGGGLHGKVGAAGSIKVTQISI